MQRYLVELKDLKIGQIISLVDNDAYHITKVMRMNIGDEILIANNEASFKGVIKEIIQNNVSVELLNVLEENPELPIEVTIAHGLVAREKREEVIQKITQLGASSYLPVAMKRSVVKVVKEKEDSQLERLQKIAKEASEQSHRIKALQVSKTISFDELLKMSSNFDACLYASTVENASSNTFKKVLRDSSIKRIIVLIGPEGGIDEEEINLLKNWIPVSLGPRILRTEVAPLYLLSAISYERELGE